MNMPMPELAIPSFPITIPSTKQKVTMRSMTTKEFKLFLIAKEGSVEEQIVHTIFSMLDACIKEDIDLKSLPMYDIEYMFLQLYVNSTAENTKTIPYKCRNTFEGEECGQQTNVTFNLADAQVDFSKCSDKTTYNAKVKSTDGQDVILKFKQPNLTSFEGAADSDFDTISNCLITVATANHIWQKDKDFDLEVAKKYVENINSLELEKITKFFYEVPELIIRDKFKCSKCGYEHKIELEGIQDFF